MAPIKAEVIAVARALAARTMAVVDLKANTKRSRR